MEGWPLIRVPYTKILFEWFADHYLWFRSWIWRWKVIVMFVEVNLFTFGYLIHFFKTNFSLHFLLFTTIPIWPQIYKLSDTFRINLLLSRKKTSVINNQWWQNAEKHHFNMSHVIAVLGAKTYYFSEYRSKTRTMLVFVQFEWEQFMIHCIIFSLGFFIKLKHLIDYNLTWISHHQIKICVYVQKKFRHIIEICLIFY